jgi:hypothetical protein
MRNCGSLCPEFRLSGYLTSSAPRLHWQRLGVHIVGSHPKSLGKPPSKTTSIEKRIARFPQFYSRIGFVHEFRPLDAAQVQELLEKRWTPVGVTLRDEQLIPEVIASLIRMTGGNFRLLTRLLTQIERVLSVNDLHLVSTAVVEAARDSLVIGPG